jgi:ATP-binding cassette subfamily B protein
VAPWVEPVEQLLSDAGIPETRRERARTALIQEQLGSTPIFCGWMLRLPPSASLWRQTVQTHLVRPILALVGGHFIYQALMLVAWWVIGRGALNGSFDRMWLLAWALLLFTAIPFQMLTTWSASQFSTKMGALFKQRLIYGTLKLHPDEIRHQGMGQFLGRVMESEAVEMLALGGGLRALVSVIQLVMAGWVLGMGSRGLVHAGLLLLWTLMILAIGWLNYRGSREWYRVYRRMTNDLVERMVGHRTRLAQEDPDRWHLDEDKALDRYLHLSSRVDYTETWLSALPHSWLVGGLAGIAWSFVKGSVDVTELAISLGGVLLAHQALTSIIGGIQSVIQMAMAWQQVAPLFHAAARPSEIQSASLFGITASTSTMVGSKERVRSPVPGAASPAPGAVSPAPGAKANLESRQPVLLVKDLNFRYCEQGQHTLKECSLRIFAGDRLLLEGPSGGGKTTLAAVVAGLRPAESGLLLLHGYDRQSLGGDAWRRQIVIAPQFHENHIFTETLAFNLLMGRRWPPTASDLTEAEALCRELGLGEMLDRMPSGLQQIVGESGWQLSHGERSRVFIARALLQSSDLIIMDESFGALDPENLYRSLHCVLQRAPALLVIAHP